jgi:hypothetical protein
MMSQHQQGRLIGRNAQSVFVETIHPPLLFRPRLKPDGFFLKRIKGAYRLKDAEPLQPF